MPLMDRLLGWMGVAGAHAPAPDAARGGGPVQAFDSFEMDDPRLAGFLAGGATGAAGIAPSAHVGLRNTTFFRGFNLITGSVGMLPLHLMRQDPDGSNKRKAREHSLFRVLHKRPNAWQTALEFKSYMQGIALLDGNAYAYAVRSGRRIIALLPLPRFSVTARLKDDLTDIEFTYRPRVGGQVTLQSNEVFHFRPPVSLDGVHGLGVLHVARETLGIAAIAQRAAARLFKNGAFAAGVLETDKSLGDDVHRRIKEDWAELYEGPENAGKWPLLEEGLKARNLSPNAKEAQHLETRQHEAEEIARVLGVPRPLLMFDETSWGTGIEQLGQFFVTYCLLPWFSAWEQAVERLLDPSEEDIFYAKFNAGALLRGSLKDQAEFFTKALGSGGAAAWMMPDEVRDAFDMNPAPGGDKLPERTAKGSDTPPPDPAPPPPPKPKKKD